MSSFGKFLCEGRYQMFGHPSKAVNVLCFDGKRRTVRLGIDADTAFSWPGRTSIKNKTIRGFVTSFINKGQKDLFFVRYSSTDRAPESTYA